ncbi:hypothetical protein FQN57_003480 [Myotisia sp. PD_48]|nr:hypothetical protein FQN57_003480 [Myotisia sp. PD_48]
MTDLLPPSTSESPKPPRLRAKWTSLFHFTSKRHIVPLVLAIIFTIAGGLVTPLLALILGKLFKAFSDFGSHSISAGRLMSTISLHCIFLVCMGGTIWVLGSVHFSLWVVFGELQAKNARKSTFEQLLEKNMAWFDGIPDGITAVLPRIQAHIRDLQLATSQPLGSALENIVAAMAALILALYISWNLTLVCLSTVPACAIVLSYFSSKMQPSIESQQAELTKASKIASAAISSIDVVKHFNSQATETTKYQLATRHAAQWYNRVALFSASQIGLINFLTFGMFVQGFWYGGSLVEQGRLNSGEVLTTFWACLQATQSIEAVIPQLIVLEKGRTAAAALQYILKDICTGFRTQTAKGRHSSPRFCEGDIKIRDVTFAYPSQPDRKVLDNCSFFFPAGDMTFVVGKSGSGKSTIGNLLLGFYAPTFGDILIDDRLIQTLDISWIRNNITLVQQQSNLFNETILKNITFGARNVDAVQATDISTAVRLAGLGETILNLPNRLDTAVGFGGSSLSGGQRQRVALARARLRDTPVLILDESTSALDISSRISLMNAIRAWRKGKTTIVITHDLTQIRAKDFVYVVDQGKITQQGYKYVLEKGAVGLFEPQSPSEAPRILPTSPAFRNFLPSASPSGSHRGNPRTQSLGNPEFDRRYSFHSPLSPVFNHRLSFYSAHYAGELIQPSPTPGARERASTATPFGVPLENFDSAGEEKDLISKYPQHCENEYSPVLHDDIFHKPKGTYSMLKILGTVVPSLGAPDRIMLFLGFIAAFFRAAATPCFSFLFSQLLSTYFLADNQSYMAKRWALAVLGVAIANGLASFFTHYLLERCGQNWIDFFRHQALQRILRQRKSWFEKETNSLSNLTVCLDRNPEEMKNLVGRFACFMFVAVVITGMGLIWGLAVCWKLTLVGAATAPPLYGLTRLYERISGIWEHRCNESSEVIAGIFSETFLDIRTVRAFTLESYFHRKHEKANSKSLTIGIKRACYSGCLYGLSEGLILFVYALVFYYGAVLVTSMQYSTQAVLIVFAMLLFSMSNIKVVLSLVPQISSSRDTASRVLQLANIPEYGSHEDLGALHIVDPVPIQFQDVSFNYPSRPRKKVLRNLNLTIKQNACTAIVGPSGSGKSTISSLILALYPAPDAVNGGKIYLGGVDIRRIHTPTLRSLISIVPQHPTLFPASIRDNINYGLEESSHLKSLGNVKVAATAAGIHEFISSLPAGYDTMIGDGGVGISGGQAQRIVIARALVRRPRVLILDEATSSLDVESATIIKKTIAKLISSNNNLTVILITHSKEMMGVAENVVVVDQGEVVEQGKFEDLMNRTRGKLRNLLKHQC